MNATRLYGDATTLPELSAQRGDGPIARRLGMAGALIGVLAQVVVRHVEETKPNRKDEAQHPGQHDAPEDPVGNAQDQDHFRCGTAVTEEVTARDAPDQAE